MNDFVRLEPAVIAEITRICDVMIAELEDAHAIANSLRITHGFGDFESAKQLAAGFNRKAAGAPESARERVEQFIDVLTRLRDAFASGGEAFLDAEFDWARQLQAIDPHA